MNKNNQRTKEVEDKFALQAQNITTTQHLSLFATMEKKK